MSAQASSGAELLLKHGRVAVGYADSPYEELVAASRAREGVVQVHVCSCLFASPL